MYQNKNQIMLFLSNLFMFEFKGIIFSNSKSQSCLKYSEYKNTGFLNVELNQN